MTTVDDDVLRFAKSRLGQVLKGKYCLDRVLGVGGMGAVYAATHRNRKRFAIKLLHQELSAVESIRTRFLREGYVANSVNHPGAVAVLDDDISEDGSAFLVMELLEGASLEALWEASGRSVPLPTLLSWLDQLLDVLAAAHAQGVIHRDLKPANLFLTESGVVKVLDFGIARLHDASGGGVTQTGATLGTPAFMAPEQALGATNQIDARTDLWAAAATMFVLITGRLVHQGETTQQLLINSATRPAPALESITTAVPPAIAAVIDRALAFAREQRFGSALEMKQALALAYREAFGSDLQSTPRPTPPALALTELSKTERASVPPPAVYFPETRPPMRNETNGLPIVHVASVASAPAKRRRYPLALLAALLLILLIVGSVLGGARYFGQSRAEPPTGSGSSGFAPPAPSSPSTSAATIAKPTGLAQSATGLANPRASGAPVPVQRPATAPAPARAPANDLSGSCARLLARQSLGETLSASDEAIFARSCRK
ncbi:MAG TPA: serine/threonine-protein kinase [Polyangiaceae bacterium]